MGRAPCCDKENVKRGPWSPEEDAKLKGFIDKYGTGGNWIALPHKAGLKRCGKSCRLRWLNYLRPNIKHGEFTDDEDRIICSLYASIGSRWSIIAGQLPGRTDNDIKNYWNTKLKKKLLAMLPSFQKKPSFFPSLPLQSPPPPPYRSDHFFTTTNSSPFSGYTTASNLMNHNINSLLTTTLVQDHINISPQPQPDLNTLISLITNNTDNNNNNNSFYLGFQDDHHQNMYNNSPMGYHYYPTSDVKEAMLMFGDNNIGGHHHHEVVSATGSSSEGGSCMSQISYNGDYTTTTKDHHNNIQKQHQIKQEEGFALQGFGGDYQSQSFMIPKVGELSYKLKNYENSDVEEVKQLMIGNRSSYWLNDDDDEYKTIHEDNKEICYDY